MMNYIITELRQCLHISALLVLCSLPFPAALEKPDTDEPIPAWECALWSEHHPHSSKNLWESGSPVPQAAAAAVEAGKNIH